MKSRHRFKQQKTETIRNNETNSETTKIKVMKTINNVQKTVKQVIATLAVILLLGTSMVTVAADSKTNTASKSKKMMNFQLPAEEQDATLSIEAWMISDSCFVVQEARMVSESQKALYKNENTFNLSILDEKATDPKLKLESWMTSETHWK
jgi:hypothetical protein